MTVRLPRIPASARYKTASLLLASPAYRWTNCTARRPGPPYGGSRALSAQRHRWRRRTDDRATGSGRQLAPPPPAMSSGNGESLQAPPAPAIPVTINGDSYADVEPETDAPDDSDGDYVP
jgi:hypothetical protein